VRKTLVARQGEIADLRRLMRERHPEEFKKTDRHGVGGGHAAVNVRSE
jgi:hypothetical protein